MEALSESDIVTYVKENIIPVDNSIYGPGYRASVYLKDGTYLPCVVFRSSKPIVDLAVRRFKEELSGKGIFAKSSGLGYLDIVKTFVAKGNCINGYDVSKVTKSRFAFPLEIQKQIKGETSMGWTAFVARLSDGRYLSFGTTWHLEFFDLPDGYNADDIVEIINNSYLLKSGEIVHHRSFDWATRREELTDINREKPFFECFLDGL
jgi:hypothetical protein